MVAVLKPLTFFTVLCLVAGLVSAGTFELTDPAAEIMEEVNKPKEEQQSQDNPDTRSSEADDLWGEWTVVGIGQTTCNDHVSHKQGSSEQYALNLLWMQGFIDGVGYQRFITLGDDRLRPVYEPASMDIWIENYCSENPPDSLMRAVESFIRETN